MKVEGDYTFDAPRDLVWEALLDPEVLGSILPGGEGIEQIGENEYAGNLKIKVGPVQGTFSGNIKLNNLVDLESYDIEVDGKGAPGFVKAGGSLKLTGREGQTDMAYHGDAQIGGRIASVGQRLLDASAKSIIKQSLDALNAYLQVEAAKRQADGPGPAGGAAAGEMGEEKAAEGPAYVPPTQTELAMNVARDVVGELIPARYRPALIIGILIIVGVIVYFLLR